MDASTLISPPSRKNLRRSSTANSANNSNLFSPRDTRQQVLLKRFGSILESDNFSRGDKKKPDEKEEEIDIEDGMSIGKRKKRRLSKTEKRKFTVNLQHVLADLQNSEDDVTFLSIKADPSVLPLRKFCSVCGFESNYRCLECKSNYCSLRCLKTHKDTRCLKFIA